MKYILFAGLLMPLQSTAQRILPITYTSSPGDVMDLETFDDKLWIAGHFSLFNGQPVHGLVSWDGQTFTSPLQGAEMLYAFNLTSFNGGLAIAGLSLNANDVLFWDGDTLVPLYGEFSNSAIVLGSFNGELFAGGGFASIDGSSVAHLARWTGSGWEQVGPGLNNRVKCMTVHDGQLYLGGDFTMTGDEQMELQHVAVWDGSSFSQLGTGLSSAPRSMLSVNGGLWLAGDFGFTADSTLQLNGRATWNGAVFEQLAMDAPNLTPPLNIVDLDSLGVLLSPTLGCSAGSARFVNNTWEPFEYSKITCSISYHDRTVVGGSFFDLLPDTIAGLGMLVPGLDRAYLHVAGISAFVRPNGALFYDRNCVTPGFHVGDQHAPSTIFSHSQYVAAFIGDSSFASSYLNFAVRGDYSAGPRCNVRDGNMINKYEHAWLIDKGTLWEHAANWDLPGHQTAYELATWPGNGNMGNGEPVVVAPFNDLDQDGIYEPENGELPLMKGDRSAFTVITDQLGDTLSYDRPAMFDINQLLFGFDDANDPALFQTMFLSYQFINRSQRQYDSVLVALTCDPDLGCAEDDFIGCDPSLAMFYAYNASSLDQPCNGQPGFMEHPPAQGIAGLNLPMRSFVYVNRNAGTCCNDPDYPSHAVNYALGHWAYGNPQSDPTNGDTTLFAFHDYPDVPGGYSGVNFSQPNDVRGIASFGPVYNIAPGDTICLDVAFVYARDTTKDNIENVRVLQEKVQAVKAWYAQQSYSCGQYPVLGLSDPQVRGIEARLFPNPTTSAITLERTMADQPAILSVYSLSGQMIMSTTIPADQHLVTLKTADLSEGPYAVHIRCGNAVQCLRFVKVSAAP